MAGAMKTVMFTTAAALLIGAAGCADLGDSIAGSKEYGPVTATEAASAAANLSYLPADTDDPDVRAAAGAAAGRIGKNLAVTQIFSAESSNDGASHYRLQLEMTDKSVWEAIMLDGDSGYEVVRLERIG